MASGMGRVRGRRKTVVYRWVEGDKIRRKEGRKEEEVEDGVGRDGDGGERKVSMYDLERL